MRETFGSMPMKKPEGMLRQLIFPELALMDVRTGDGRRLMQDGRGVRDLPRTIYGQFVQADGHAGSVPVGALHEVTFEDGVASGRGWAIDDENGRKAVTYIEAQVLRHNSVDLSDIKVEYQYDPENDEFTVDFTSWKIGATTLVGKPAFANAHVELLEDEELVASWLTDDTPLVVSAPIEYNVRVAEEEIVADGSPLPAWDMFHVPEPDTAKKLTVGEPDANGFIPVFGHLSLWDSCHDGYLARCTRTPRPDDNYASFNKPGVLTDNGIVGTGPIFLEGGHRRAPDGDYVSAYGGIENAWADVRIVAGKLGPWCSGYVRPGTDETKVLAARASRISGHWLGKRLKAIVSVNAEGYDVPGDDVYTTAATAFSLDSDGHVLELVASFPDCIDDADAADEPAAERDDAAETSRPAVSALDLALLDDMLADDEAGE